MARGLQAGYGQLQGFSLNMFSSHEYEELHLGTLDVLQNYGVLVFGDEALDIFEKNGAFVDRQSNRVRIPAHLVEDAIHSAPSTILLAGRNPKFDVTLQQRRTGFTNFGAGVMVVDPFTGEYRESNKQDVAYTALAVDALEHVDIYSSAVVARDVNEKATDLHEAEAFLSNTSKHCQHIDLTGGAGARKFFEMAAAIVGGMGKLRERPIVSALVCPTSPLQLHLHTAEIIIECARAGVPVNVLSMAMSGASAPVTLAGTLVTHNAEVLAGITLHQLTSRGAPVIYGSSTTTFDLTYVTAPVGAPELGMISSAVAGLATYYMLPSYVAGA
jgi:trimethylamine--corrinoid protein Co-methyltransferase